MSATKALRAPSKIASALDWKKASGAILALDVGADRIGLAVASHPSYGDAPLPLKAVNIQLETSQNNKKRVLSQSVVSQLQKIVKEHNVSSFVVSWPVQKEGRCGAPCGKVLHTLDSLVEASNLMNANRPFCLWDNHHTQTAPENTDAFGRNPLYGEPCHETGKTVHKASEEQYTHHECSSKVAASVMEDFIQSQWPEIYQQQQQQQQQFVSEPVSQPAEISFEWLEHYEDTDAYMSVAV